jgi:hypothetical protein
MVVVVEIEILRKLQGDDGAISEVLIKIVTKKKYDRNVDMIGSYLSVCLFCQLDNWWGLCRDLKLCGGNYSRGWNW